MLRILGSPKNLCGGMTRRDWLRIGGLGLAGLTLPDVLRLQEVGRGEEHEVARARLWPGEGDHPDSPVWLAEPARMGRSQAGRAGRNSRRVRRDSVVAARLQGVRAVSEHGEGDGPHDGHPLADASLSAARRGLRPDRRAGDRRADGARAARSRGIGRSSARSWNTCRDRWPRFAAGRMPAPGVPNNIALPFRFSSAARSARCIAPGRMRRSSAASTIRCGPIFAARRPRESPRRSAT